MMFLFIKEFSYRILVGFIYRITILRTYTTFVIIVKRNLIKTNIYFIIYKITIFIIWKGIGMCC